MTEQPTKSAVETSEESGAALDTLKQPPGQWLLAMLGYGLPFIFATDILFVIVHIALGRAPGPYDRMAADTAALLFGLLWPIRIWARDERLTFLGAMLKGGLLIGFVVSLLAITQNLKEDFHASAEAGAAIHGIRRQTMPEDEALDTLERLHQAGRGEATAFLLDYYSRKAHTSDAAMSIKLTWMVNDALAHHRFSQIRPVAVSVAALQKSGWNLMLDGTAIARLAQLKALEPRTQRVLELLSLTVAEGLQSRHIGRVLDLYVNGIPKALPSR